MAATVLDTAHSCLARRIVTMTTLGPGDVMIRCHLVLWLTWFTSSPQHIHLRVGLHSRLVWLYRCSSSRGPEFVVGCGFHLSAEGILQISVTITCRNAAVARTHTHTHTRHGTLFHVHQKKKFEKYHVILKIYITETNDHAPPDRSVVKQVCVALQIGLYTLVTFTDKMSLTRDTKASSVALPACMPLR